MMLLLCTQFSQSSDLEAKLLETQGTMLVARNTVWGIGLSAKNWKAQHREYWRGNKVVQHT